MQLQAGMPCSTAAAAAATEAEAKTEEVLVQPWFFPQNHQQVHISCYLYQVESTRRCTQTGTVPTQQHTSRDKEPRHNKGEALDSSPVALSFHCSWEKKGILGSPISTFTHTHTHKDSLHTDMYIGQKQNCTDTKFTSRHVKLAPNLAL